ncbi:hypothetical protein V6N11_012499 [Hibiscus sabdariffa]|uniref:Uncharacterized protein n=1 Tax=Hibiscus sabdariffa TaxID=183260 RepID=A0ABR2QBG2_9ROSI
MELRFFFFWRNQILVTGSPTRLKISLRNLDDEEKVENNEKKQGEGDARVVEMEEEDKRMVRPDEGDGGGGRWNGCG